MSNHIGIINKMTVNNCQAVKYTLPLSDKNININKLIDTTLKISFQNKIHCTKCGKLIKKSYINGFCYDCFCTAPEADVCIFSPEKCKAHIGITRDLEWAKKNCLKEHIVYLSLTSHVKVGVTRLSQLPTRWIDQGAIRAIKFAETPYRELAGQIEVDLKKYFSDKTNWRAMLKNDIKEADLSIEKQKAVNYLRPDLKKYILIDNEITKIEYPIKNFPKKIKSINFDKTDEFKGKLIGIKGQYLIFENGFVINIRRHSGYLVKIET